MKQKLLCFFMLGVLLIGSAYAQDKRVSGRVTAAADGAPISGVSVIAVGANLAVQTDELGTFTITVPANTAELEFRFLGFETKRQSIQGVQNISVVLESDETALSEVVVTALGVTRERKALGVATQEVKAEQLTTGANTSLATSLQGKVSGIEVTPSSGMPGSSAKVTIRGARSFSDDNTPLYVIDGMPISSTGDVSTGNSVTGADYANRLLDIDPNDIETINVLKGQAASALYGMRASNGAIIITTKSGKGAAIGKPQITFNTNNSFDRVSVLPDFQMDYAQGSGGVFNPNASTAWGPLIDNLADDPNYGGNTDNQYSGGDPQYRGKYYVVQRARAGLDPWTTPQRYKNTEEFFQTGATYNNSLNIIQAFERANYVFTFGNTNQNGIIPSTGLDRYNAKLGAETKMGDQWTTGFVGNYITSKLFKQSSANDGLIATVYGAPPSYDLKGIPSHVDGDPYTQLTYRGVPGFPAAYWAIEHNEFSERTNRFFGNAYAQYLTDFGKDNQKLTIKYQLGNDSYTTNYTDLFGYGYSNGRGSIEEFSYTVSEVNSLLTGAYTWDINDDLVLDALIGNEFVHNQTKYNYTSGINFNFSGWNHIKNASVYNSSGSFRERRTVGTFGSLALAYRDMLFFNATGRYDVVSSMPRNNRSFFYPSASLSWVFTELDGLRGDVLTFGKLRASYAEVGQAGDYIDSYYATPSYGGGFSSGIPIQYPINGVVAYTQYPVVYDPNLRPQNTVAYEIGGDFSFWGGLLSLNYTYSRQNVKDQIFQVPLAGSTGSSGLITNGGSIHTNSHEITLGSSPVNTENIRWDFAFNFTKIDNYVDELAEGVENIFLGGFVEPQVRAGIGYKYPVIYGNSYARNEQGQIVVDEDGMPSAGPLDVIGTVAPDFILGFNTTLQVYKARLSAVFDWKNGGQMYSGTSGLLDFYGVSQYSADVRKPGTSFRFPEPAVKVTSRDADGNPTAYAPNDIDIPAENAQDYFTVLNNISESMIYDNSFVKLREVSLGYPVYNRPNVNVDLRFFARNIILWSEFKGLDPEASQGNNNMSGAFERFSLPGTSTFGLGLNIKF